MCVLPIIVFYLCSSFLYFCAIDLAEVRFEVSYNSASASDVQVTPSSGVVQLAAGDMQASISVAVLEDNTPEEEELLSVRLLSTSGDTVLGIPITATLIIPPNDDPNGLFSFSEASLMVDTEEGQTLDLV